MNPDALGQIKPITKKDQIVISVKNAILAGKLESGDPIVENKIAQQLGVGTPLVREALIELEHQGFVQKVPFKGTIVTKLSREDVDNIFRLRAELEALALEWAKEDVTDADIEQLRVFTESMKKAAMALDLRMLHRSGFQIVPTSQFVPLRLQTSFTRPTCYDRKAARAPLLPYPWIDLSRVCTSR